MAAQHHEFTFKALNESSTAQVQKLANAFDALLDTLLAANPGQSHEMAICKTKLEEACFYAVKALTLQDETGGTTGTGSAAAGTSATA